MRSLRGLPLFWQWGQGVNERPWFACIHTFPLISSPDETDITWNQSQIHPPGMAFREEAPDVTLQHRRRNGATTRASCHYRYSMVQFTVTQINYHRLIMGSTRQRRLWEVSPHFPFPNVHLYKPTQTCCYDGVKNSDILTGYATTNGLTGFIWFWCNDRVIILKQTCWGEKTWEVS